ncbi:MAG: hypothetical protein ACRDLQ_00400 [Solirubrobacterales bacterium]
MTGLARRHIQRLGLAASTATGFALLAAAPAHAASEPAGGAPTADIVIATLGATVLTALLLAVGMGHRSGRVKLLGHAAAWTERKTGLPGWAALPGAISSVALLVALLGMYWDISLHIDDGRDAGPLANPAHYLILAGLFGVFMAGFLAMVLPKERPGRSAVRITRTWHAPVGGVLLFACGAFSLSGFPLDDFWHRMFGQDVTLWGPTHLMLIGGAAMTLVGRSVLLVEGARVARERNGRTSKALAPRMLRVQRATLVGAFLIGLSTFQAEFDFGVPQFDFLFHPMLVMLAASVALVAARLWAGPGGALIAVALFVAVRGGVSLLVGPAFGETTPHFPLYAAEAVLVELVARRALIARPLAFGAVAGALIGTVGLAAEWGWSHLWMPLAWPESMLPEAVAVGLAAAVAGGTIGALIGSALASDHVPRPRGATPALVAASLALAMLIGYGLQTSPSPGESARVSLTDVRGGAERQVSARVELSPRGAADDARWLTVTAWQGGGLVLDKLERVGPGVYRTTRPIPVYGEWKALLRLHRGDSLQGVPIYLPRDPAIPAAEVPAERTFVRTFVSDTRLLQREAKDATFPMLSVLAYGTVLGIALSLLGGMAWGLGRLAGAGRADWRRPPRSGRPAPLTPRGRLSAP